MASQRAQKSKKKTKLPESSGQTQASVQIDHAFAATDTGKKRSRLSGFSNKQRISVAAAVAILLVGGGLILFWQARPDSISDDSTLTTEGIQLRKLDQEKLLTEVEKLVFEKKYKSARELVNFQDYGDTKSMQIVVATVFINQGIHKEAIQILLAVEEKNDPDWKVAKMLGEQYEALGKKEQALTYYKQALELVKKAKDVPLQQDEIYYLETDIKEVEGRQ